MCKKTAQKNKRLLLLYLIPVEMLLGRMPSSKLLRKYSLTQLAEIVSAVKSGNLRVRDLCVLLTLRPTENLFNNMKIFLYLEDFT